LPAASRAAATSSSRATISSHSRPYFLYYTGQVKCIYIDPPYNSGVDERDEEGKRSGWIYNDNVSSPIIRDWLGKVVGEEAKDLFRHDK
jgi:adenine-specific DNA-methyltransferase